MQIADQAGAGRRRRRVGQEGEARRPASAGGPCRSPTRRALTASAVDGLAALGVGGRAVRVVEVEDRGLGQERARPAVRARRSGCPRASSGGPGGSRPGAGSPSCASASPSHSRAAARGPRPRPTCRKEGCSPRACRHPASPTPPSAKEAAMIFMNCLRSTPSRFEAPSGNSLPSAALNPGRRRELVQAAPVARPGHRPFGRRRDVQSCVSSMAAGAALRGFDLPVVHELAGRLDALRLRRWSWSPG